MASAPSPAHAENANEDDPSAASDSFFYAHEDHDASPGHDLMMKDDALGDGKPVKDSLPMQKRRRVTRACDECRRKKIKCDGKQPCTHCTVYSYGELSLPRLSACCRQLMLTEIAP